MVEAKVYVKWIPEGSGYDTGGSAELINLDNIVKLCGELRKTFDLILPCEGQDLDPKQLHHFSLELGTETTSGGKTVVRSSEIAGKLNQKLAGKAMKGDAYLLELPNFSKIVKFLARADDDTSNVLPEKDDVDPSMNAVSFSAGSTQTRRYVTCNSKTCCPVEVPLLINDATSVKAVLSEVNGSAEMVLRIEFEQPL